MAADKKKKVVRKKKLAGGGGVDDPKALLRQQKQAAKMKKEREAAEARKREEEAQRAEEARKKAELEKRRATKRRKLEAKKKAEEDALEAEKRRLEEEKRKLEEEKQRLELEAERAKLEAERAKLEAERKKLSEAPKAAEEAEELPAIDPSEMDEILALAGEGEGGDEEFDDMPPAKPVRAKTLKPKPQSKKQPAAKKPSQAGAPRPKTTKAKRAPAAATAAAEPDDGVQMKVVEEPEPESVKDWISDIQGGAPWQRIGLIYGIPALIFILFMWRYGSGIAYNFGALQRLKAIPPLNIRPEAGDLPKAPPDVQPTQTWVPIGPVRILAPKSGPIAIDWTRPQSPVEYVEFITLYFPGWQLQVARHKKDALLKALDGQAPATLIIHYATEGGDEPLVKEVMDTRPADFGWLEPSGVVERFKAKMRLKLDMFPEIREGVELVNYGSASGYFFGRPGSEKPQRIEVFNTSGFRFSYLFEAGTVMRQRTKLQYAQASAQQYAQKAKSEFKEALAAFENAPGGEAYRQLLRAGMYAAGLAIGEELDITSVDNVRTALNTSDYTKLADPRSKSVDYEEAFDRLKGPKTLAELRRVLLGLLAHPSESIRKRAASLAQRLKDDSLAPGQAGFDEFERWVEAQEEYEAQQEAGKKDGDGE